MLKIGDRIIYVPAKEYKGTIINIKTKISGSLKFNVLWDNLPTHREYWYTERDLMPDKLINSKDKYSHLFMNA